MRNEKLIIELRLLMRYVNLFHTKWFTGIIVGRSGGEIA